MGKIANRQSLAFSERNQLSQAILQSHVERMLNEETPIARFESQHHERRVCEDWPLWFGGRYDRQRTLATRIAAITLASDSAIAIARFRPSKIPTEPPKSLETKGKTLKKREKHSKKQGNSSQRHNKKEYAQKKKEKRKGRTGWRRGKGWHLVRYHPNRNGCYSNLSEITMLPQTIAILILGEYWKEGKGYQKRAPSLLVAHNCGYPLSRYTCRATRVAPNFLDFIAFCRCSTGVALHPLKILVSHLPPPCAGRCRTEIWV